MTKNYWLRFFIFVFFTVFYMGYMLCANVVCAAQAATLDGLLRSIHTLQADFVQTVIDLHGNQINHSKGKIWLQRPGRLRLETHGSDTQVIVADGKNISIYDPDLQQLSIRPLHAQGLEVPALLLSEENILAEKNFTVSRLATTKAGSGASAFLLMPKDKNSSLSSLSLEFTHGLLSAMQFSNYLEQTTTLHFSHVKTGMALPAKLFHFVPPRGTDIVKTSA